MGDLRDCFAAFKAKAQSRQLPAVRPADDYRPAAPAKHTSPEARKSCGNGGGGSGGNRDSAAAAAPPPPQLPYHATSGQGPPASAAPPGRQQQRRRAARPAAHAEAPAQLADALGSRAVAGVSIRQQALSRAASLLRLRPAVAGAARRPQHAAQDLAGAGPQEKSWHQQDEQQQQGQGPGLQEQYVGAGITGGEGQLPFEKPRGASAGLSLAVSTHSTHSSSGNRRARAAGPPAMPATSHRLAVLPLLPPAAQNRNQQEQQQLHEAERHRRQQGHQQQEGQQQQAQRHLQQQQQQQQQQQKQQQQDAEGCRCQQARQQQEGRQPQEQHLLQPQQHSAQPGSFADARAFLQRLAAKAAGSTGGLPSGSAGGRQLSSQHHRSGRSVSGTAAASGQPLAEPLRAWQPCLEDNALSGKAGGTSGISTLVPAAGAWPDSRSPSAPDGAQLQGDGTAEGSPLLPGSNSPWGGLSELLPCSGKPRAEAGTAAPDQAEPSWLFPQEGAGGAAAAFQEQCVRPSSPSGSSASLPACDVHVATASPSWRRQLPGWPGTAPAELLGSPEEASAAPLAATGGLEAAAEEGPLDLDSLFHAAKRRRQLAATLGNDGSSGAQPTSFVERGTWLLPAREQEEQGAADDAGGDSWPGLRRVGQGVYGVPAALGQRESFQRMLQQDEPLLPVRFGQRSPQPFSRGGPPWEVRADAELPAFLERQQQAAQPWMTQLGGGVSGLAGPATGGYPGDDELPFLSF